MQSLRCKTCQGSGKVMGGGMIYHDCDNCDGDGKIKKPDDEINYLTLKQSESYQDAIKEIKSIDSKITTNDADKMLKKQFEKQKLRKKK